MEEINELQELIEEGVRTAYTMEELYEMRDRVAELLDTVDSVITDRKRS